MQSAVPLSSSTQHLGHCAAQQQLTRACRGCTVGRRDLRKAELIQKLRSWLSPEGTEEEPVRRAALELGHLTIPQLKDWLRDRGVSVKGAPRPSSLCLLYDLKEHAA